MERIHVDADGSGPLAELVDPECRPAAVGDGRSALSQ